MTSQPWREDGRGFVASLQHGDEVQKKPNVQHTQKVVFNKPYSTYISILNTQYSQTTVW